MALIAPPEVAAVTVVSDGPASSPAHGDADAGSKNQDYADNRDSSDSQSRHSIGFRRKKPGLYLGKTTSGGSHATDDDNDNDNDHNADTRVSLVLTSPGGNEYAPELDAAHACSYKHHGSRMFLQELWDCNTCGWHYPAACVCKVCAFRCHKTHELVALGPRQGSCDCGAGLGKSLKPPVVCECLLTPLELMRLEDPTLPEEPNVPDPDAVAAQAKAQAQASTGASASASAGSEANKSSADAPKSKSAGQQSGCCVLL